MESIVKVHILVSRQNTYMTVTDKTGNTLAWRSAGSCGFKNSRRSTPFAAEKCARSVGSYIKEKGYSSVELSIKGMSFNRSYCLRAFVKSGLKIKKFIDNTPVVYNGCRPPKKRRI